MKGIKIITLIAVVCMLALTGCKKDKHTHSFENGECACGEKEPHTHSFENGLCSCGEKDPNFQTTSFDEVETWLNEEIDPLVIDEDLYPLPTKYQDKNVSISWESSNQVLMNNEGKIIKRNTKEISEADLTYTITNEFGETKSDKITVKVYPRTFSYMQTRVEAQFPEKITESIDYMNLNISSAFTVTWTSSDQSILKDDGTYIKPEVDTEITINYRIEALDGIYRDYSFQVVVVCATDEEKLDLIESWVENENIPDLNVKQNISLPTTHPDHGGTISWQTSDETIIDIDGTVKRYVFDRYVELICTIEYSGKQRRKSYYFKVEAKDITNMSQDEIVVEFVNVIATENLSKVFFTQYGNINQSYNILRFFDNEWEPQIEQIAPLGSNRPGTKMGKVYFVLVHDTANNNAGAKAHANYVEQGGGGTSFQYCVGNDGIYHLIPNDEVAYHAGDGTGTTFEYLDSGVKATVERPHISIDKNGYFAFNGVSSTLKIPTGATPNTSITPSGLHCKVGTNGNYYLAKNYFNTDYGFISNRGGNNNSIGIETCVDKGSDYLKTLRYNADLVARLLIENNLDVLDVIQHNNTSGKYCPAAIRTANYWQNFRDLVSLEKFGMEHFDGLTFEWLSKSNILSNDGYINIQTNNETSVSYSVVVKRGETAIYSKDFTTILTTNLK